MVKMVMAEVDPPLRALGELLAREGDHFGLVIVGGAALNLLGLIHRPTEDVDVLAFGTREPDTGMQIVPPPSPLPDVLTKAIQQIADDFQLADDWLNANVAGHWRTGLRPGWTTRVRWVELPGISLGLVHRSDLIFLKLYAAADHAQLDLTRYVPSKHDLDLIALAPSEEEFEAARIWVCAQDGSPQYPQFVDNVIAYVQQAHR